MGINTVLFLCGLPKNKYKINPEPAKPQCMLSIMHGDQPIDFLTAG